MRAWRLIDVLFPGRCLLCKGRSPAELCRACDRDLPAITYACNRCAIPLECARPTAEAGQYCGACITDPPPYDRAIAALDYVFPNTVLVQRFKLSRSFACGSVLAGRLLKAVETRVDLASEPVDLLIPVPMHPARQFLRVFNQAEVLARDLGRALGIRVSPRALRRNRRTPSQTGLTAAGRRKNLVGAISATPIEAHRVALVDDVMTTGATLGECAKALKHSGVESVVVWVAARAS
jgi:ComF family protein